MNKIIEKNKKSFIMRIIEYRRKKMKKILKFGKIFMFIGCRN